MRVQSFNLQLIQVGHSPKSIVCIATYAGLDAPSQGIVRKFLRISLASLGKWMLQSALRTNHYNFKDGPAHGDVVFPSLILLINGYMSYIAVLRWERA